MLRDSYLLQRLEAPLPHKALAGEVLSHHIFGGGMLGFSKAAWGVLDPICTVAYMGAAEYEFGTLPSSFSRIGDMAKEGLLTTFAFVLSPAERTLNWQRKSRWDKNKAKFPPAQYVTIYGLCSKNQVAEIRERVESLCRNADKHRSKGEHNIDSSLDPLSDYQKRTLGWLDVDNSFLFFRDETMWRGFCLLFGVTELCDIPSTPTVVNYGAMKKDELVRAAVSLGVTRTKSDATKLSKKDLVSLLSGGTRNDQQSP